MYTVGSIAQILDVKRETVRRWIATGKLKATLTANENHTSGQKLYVINDEDFEDFLLINARYATKVDMLEDKLEYRSAANKKIEKILTLLDEIETLLEDLRN